VLLATGFAHGQELTQAAGLITRARAYRRPA